ncbi:hypothetical protein TRVL_04966 [Trypanosoma vivax]|uniref:Uncharacterized protein n=1 Tax=Trypanosoma vivax (strain Y486) TaxID=1055687 RepID=G0U1U8_TRYVY|nr:hypothetical protein TRVL_04966 [Trypanosoma vivax]CCC50247.1 conserved hypothetical protein [Trypanosoma vivax Y486]
MTAVLQLRFVFHLFIFKPQSIDTVAHSPSRTRGGAPKRYSFPPHSKLKPVTATLFCRCCSCYLFLVEMGRSNNQLRRTAKARGKQFIPKKRKSKAYNQMRAMMIHSSHSKPRKISYRNVISKKGGVKRRKFHSGGYNHSGKFGKARGAKENAKKGF